jgi:hypothetical protein
MAEDNDTADFNERLRKTLERNQPPNAVQIPIENVEFIMKSHQCDQDEAIQIAYDLAVGKRKVMTNEQLLKAVGVPAKPYATDPRLDSLYQMTRPVKVVPAPIVASFDQPKHPANRQNGHKNAAEIIMNAIARGESLMPPSPPAGSTRLEKDDSEE